MTANKTALMNMTDEARLKLWADLDETKRFGTLNQAKKHNAQQEIKDLVKKMNKAMEKEDFAKVLQFNRNIKHQFEMIAIFERAIEAAEEKLKYLQRHESGFGPIQEFLEEMLDMDISWHSRMKEEHAGKSLKELLDTVAQGNQSVAMLIKMSGEEALKTFKKDLDIRFVKIQKQIEAKVGDVEDFDLDRNYNDGLDGYVIGDKATASIRTIVAGGYNIQRAHYRTLVKVEK